MIIFDIHRHGRTDASKAVSHECDQRSVAQTDDGRDVDAIEQRARLVGPIWFCSHQQKNRLTAVM
jgi:hypothetical protein